MSSGQDTLTSTQREMWVDALRVVVIAGVIVMHTATGYVVDIAGWYYDDELDASGAFAMLLSFPAALGGLFALGPLFFVAGWFSAVSLAHHGPSHFLRSRLLRLGLPLVVFVLVVNPLCDFVGNYRQEGEPLTSYYTAEDYEVGVMWFVVALLVFSFGYAGLRRLRPRPAGPAIGEPAPGAEAPRPSRPDHSGRLARRVAVVAADGGRVHEPAGRALAAGRRAVRARGGGGRDPVAGRGVPVLPAAHRLGGRSRRRGAPRAHGRGAGERRLRRRHGGAGVRHGAVRPAGRDHRRHRHRLAGGRAARRSWDDPAAAAVQGRAGVVRDVLPAPARGHDLDDALRPGSRGAEVKFVLVSAVAVPACFALGYAATRVPGLAKVL